MIKKIFFILLIIHTSLNKAYCDHCDCLVSGTLSRGGDGGGTNTGGIIAGGVIGSSAAAGASALAFAPLLLAGLEPNSIICAAAPLECIACIQNYLQQAIVDHLGSAQDICAAILKLKTGCKKYLAQNNSEIINGTYDMHSLTIPKELQSAEKIRVNVTIASQGYQQVGGEPELVFGIYKNIKQENLSKKFETQQFMHHYLMKKYETPLKITAQNYPMGMQKLSGVIDMKQIDNAANPIQVILRYTEGGFRKNLKRINPKTLTYAYLIELEKIR